MATRKEMIESLRGKGLTYEEIGEVLGITKQRVHQIATKGYTDKFHPESVRQIRFVGLRNWMLKNRVKVCELEKMCGLSKIYRSIVTDSYEPSKRTIDAILKVTGLTYEECFREEPDTEGQCSE